MKIAVAHNEGVVADHFGHCEAFAVYTATEGVVIAQETIKNPGHQRGFLPGFLQEQDVDVIIAGGMGRAAIDLFHEHGIKVIVGVNGGADAAALAFLQGNLETTGTACNHHN